MYQNSKSIPQQLIIRFQANRASIRDCGSRFGTFVNDDKVEESPLVDGDRVRLGQTELRVIDATLGSTEQTPGSAGLATLMAGLRALEAGRSLDEVLLVVLDSAIEASGAERGFVMLADLEGRLQFKLARALGGHDLSGQAFETSRRIPEEVFATGERRIVHDMLDGDLIINAQRHRRPRHPKRAVPSAPTPRPQ